MSEELEGTVRASRSGHGFVVCADQSTIYLSPSEMQAVMHGDRVKVRVVREDRRGRPEGHVLEVVERRVHRIIGRLLHEDGTWLVAPEDKRYGRDVLVPADALAGARAGQIVAAELAQPPVLHGSPVGRVVEILGEIDDPGIEIEIAVREYDVPHAFSEACAARSADLPDAVQASDKRGRVDLTDVPFVTIDGADARDFDDAVFCTPGDAPDTWRLLVAIADVSHYVRDGDAIDQDAYERATSVYFPRRVIPMLPEKLSNGVCSLNPDVERLTMVCDMVVTDAGAIAAYQFYPAVIRSHARLTYDEVAAVLTNTRGPEAAQRADRVDDLLHLQAVYRPLLRARDQRGAIDFDLPETQIVCDEWGRIASIVPRERTEAHRIIEECMLAANVCAADFIGRAGRTALYRVHEAPPPDKVEALRAYLKAVALPNALGDPPKPRDFLRISDAAQGRVDAQQVQMMLLRSMNQAVYTPDNRGHFGLAYAAYTHFTSPIRRYPDLLVHRVIRSILEGKAYRLRKLPPIGPVEERFGRAPSSTPVPGDVQPARKSAKRVGVYDARWQDAGLHCSACERRADEASRDVESWLKCEYMRAHLGEEFDGTVSGVASFGLFVTLNALFVDGLVHITELGGEYFRFDEVRQELRGERTGIRYHLGSRVRVQVSRVNLDARQIDFRLLHEGDPRTSAALADKRSAQREDRRRGGTPGEAAGAKQRASRSSASKANGSVKKKGRAAAKSGKHGKGARH